MALGFNYTLSVDEDNSLRSLTKFLEKVEGQKVVLGLDFDMNALSDMLKKIQTEITNASKNLTLTFGSFRIDEDELQRTLKQAGQDTKVAANVAVNLDDGDMKGITQAFSDVPITLEREINKIKDSLTVSLNNLAQSAKNNGLQNLIPIDEIERSIKELHTTGNSLGEIRKEASFVRQEISSWSQVAKGQAAIFRTTATEAGTVADRVASINKSMETTALERYRRQLQLNLDTQLDNIKYSKEFVKLTESQKSAFNKLASAASLTETSMRGLKDEYGELNLRIREFKQHDLAPVVRDQEKSFSNLFSAIGKGAFYFNEIGEALGITSIRLGDAIQHLRDVDEAFINVRRTMGTSQTQFDGMIDVASDIAYQNGIAVESVLEMVKVYGNAGTTMEQIKAKLDVAAQFQAISGQDATQVTTSMQAIMNQFKMAQDTAEETTTSMQRLGDVLVGVGYSLEKDEGLAMQDIISGVEAAGAVVHNAGGSFEWLASVVATLSEQMNATGDETGNAMKMIAARTLQSKEAIEELAASGEDMSDISVKASNAEKALKEIGVSVRESNGEFKDLEGILGEVASKWDTLNNTQKQMVSEQLAGNNRRNYFISLMEDYDRVIQLQNTANTSQGAMMMATERQSESLEIMITRLTNSFKELYRSLLDSDGLKLLIKTLDLTIQGFTKLNDFLGGGLMPTLGMVTGAFLALKIEMSAITGQGLIGGAIALFNQLGTALAGLAAKAGLARMAMGGLIGLIGGVAIAGIGKLIQSFKNQKNATEEVTEALNIANDVVKNYSDQMNQIDADSAGLANIESMKEQMESLNKTTDAYRQKQESINTSIESYAESYPDLAPILHNENIELDEKIRLIQEAIDKKKEEAALDAQKAAGSVNDITAQVENALKQVETYKMLKEAIDEANRKGVDSSGLLPDGTLFETNVNGMIMNLQSLEEQMASVNQSMGINEDSMNQIIATYGNLADMGLITKGEFDQVEEALRGLAETMGWSTSIMDDVADGVEESTDGIEELGDEAEQATDKISRLNDVMNENLSKAGDVNAQYVETLNYLEEAGELMAKLEDGVDLSDMNDMLDSDLMADYAGSYDDVASAIDHVKGKMGELQDTAYETYMNMQLADDDYWQQAVASCADALGVNEQEFADYVNSKGGMREVDVENAENATDAENQANTDLVRQGLINYASFVTGKGDNRKTDMQNVTNFLNTQGAKEAQTIDQLAKMWSDYYNAKKKSINAEISQAKAMQGWAGDPTKRKTSAEMAQLQADIAALERANTMMTNYFGGVSTTFKNISSGLSQAAANAGKAINDAVGSGYKSGKAGSGSGSKGSGSKGSGSKGGSSSTKQEVEDMEKLTDRYYKFEDALRNVEKQLEKTRAERENITTKKDYEKSINTEIKLINDQIKAMKNIQKEYQKERDEIKKTLQDNGFKFDKNGDITNYQKQLDKLVNQANKISDPEKKKLMQAQVQALADLIERYNELEDETIPDTSTEIEDLKAQIADLTADLAEQTEVIEDLGEAYYTLNRQISDVDNALDMNQAKQEHAQGQDQIDLLEEQIDLLKQKQDLNKQAQKNAQDEADKAKNDLGKQGVKFDKDGNITNYEQLIQQLTAHANTLVGDEKQKALDELQKLIEAMDDYTKLTQETLPDLELDWQDYQNQIDDVKNTLAELHQEEVENATEAQKQVAEAYEHYLTERYNKVKDALKKEQEEYNKAYEEENFERGLADEQRKLDEIAQQIAIYERDMSAAGQAKLAQLRAEYEAQRNAMNEIIRENEHEQTNESFDDQQESLDQALADALDPAKLVQVVNDAIGSGLITIGDQVVELDDLMTTWLDETGDGLYTIGDTLKTELLDNLNAAKETLTEMGLTNGAGIDLFSKSSTLLNNAAGTTNTMTGGVTFGAPLLYVEGNVDSSNIDDITTELQNMEQRIYKNIAGALK